MTENHKPCVCCAATTRTILRYAEALDRLRERLSEIDEKADEDSVFEPNISVDEVRKYIRQAFGV